MQLANSASFKYIHDTILKLTTLRSYIYDGACDIFILYIAVLYERTKCVRC